MNKSVYIIAANAHSGKSVVTLGVLQMIMRNTAKVGYFRPIIESKSKKDTFIETVLEHFKLDMSYDEAYAYTRQEVIALKNEGNIGEVYDTIIKKYKALESKFDFVLVDSSSVVDDSYFDVNFNASVAQSLNIPALVVLKDNFTSEDELANQVQAALNNFLYVCPHPDGASCAGAPRVCESAPRPHQRGRQRRGKKGRRLRRRPGESVFRGQT